MSLPEPSTPTILIVDDMKENIVFLSRLLKDQADIIFATNGQSALEKATNQHPTLILLDISMPEMDGFEVLQQLKASSLTADIPVIFVTGIPDTDTEEKGLNMGAIDYITKPFAPSVVRARVRNQLKLSRLNRELIATNAELTRMAMTDPLTGIFNRRHFMNATINELQRFHRHSHPVGMVILDIDNFKHINDEFGHDTGDRVLVHTAATCKTLLRTNDVFGRIGGEEFTVLLPETPLEEAGTIAERLRELICNSPLELNSGQLGYTASFGVTKLQSGDQSSEQALKRADLALYRAKANGRNNVVVFERDSVKG